MTEVNAVDTIGESLLGLIGRMLKSDKSLLSEGVVIYTSYGICRGRISRSNLPADGANAVSSDLLHLRSPVLLEVEDATVEHYANHLAAGRYERLFVNVNDICSFALTDGK
jgi:hypothetical protein